jgi:hypothetical protein
MTKGILTNVIGDATTPQRINENEIVVITHCCNNGVNGDGIGVMGAGVALSLRRKWEKVFEKYKKMEKQSPKGLKNRLGENCYVRVEEDVIVVNMIAQDGIISTNNPKPIKYWALMRCMEAIRTDLFSYIGTNSQYDGRKPVIHTPKFGSERGGGNFDFILELIREIWLEAGIDVVVYEYVG